MSGLILFTVLTLGWLPIQNVYAGKLNTADIEAANSILQRLHKLQDQSELNDRIKKQRLEEVNNHNERVKFLYKLSQATQELYQPEEQKDDSDLFNKIHVVDINEKSDDADNDFVVLQKALALLQGASDNKPVELPLLQAYEKINRNKPVLSLNKETGKKKVNLPLLRDLENLNSQSVLSVDNDKLASKSFWAQKSNVKGEKFSSEERIPVLSLKKRSGLDKKKVLDRYDNSEKGPVNNVLEQIVTLLQQQQNHHADKLPNIISWKSKNKGNSDGFLSDLNLKILLKKLQKKSKVEQQNYFKKSSHAETEVNKNNEETTEDKLDGYSKVYFVFDPNAIKSESNKHQVNKVLAKLSSWAAKLDKYWEPKLTNKKILSAKRIRRRRTAYSDETVDRGQNHRERTRNDEYPSVKYRSNNINKRHQRGRMNLRISRTAAPFVHPRGDIYEKNND